MVYNNSMDDAAQTHVRWRCIHHGWKRSVDEVCFTTGERKFWKIAELFRISSMTDSFKYKPRFVLTLQFSTGPLKLFKFAEIVRPFTSVGGS